jgi:hypothetical protein
MDQDLLIFLSNEGNLNEEPRGTLKRLYIELKQPSFEYKVLNGSTWIPSQDKGLLQDQELRYVTDRSRQYQYQQVWVRPNPM